MPATIDDHARVTAQVCRGGQGLLAQVPDTLVRQIDTGYQFGGTPEGRGGRAGPHADAAAGAEIVADDGLVGERGLIGAWFQ